MIMRILYYVILIFYSNILYAQAFEGKYELLRKEVNFSPLKTIKESRSLKKKALEINDVQTASKSDYIAGFAFYLLGNSDSCVHYANEAIALSIEKNYPAGQALGLRLLGTQYAKLGLVDNAQKKLSEALNIANKGNTDELNEIKGMTYSSILVLLDDTKNLEQKIVVAKKAINSYNKIKNISKRKQLLPSAYTNLGYLYSKIEDYDSAFIYFNKGLQILESDNHYMHASIYHDIGFTQTKQKKYRESIKSFKTALSYCENNEMVEKKLEILEGISESYSQLGENDEALFYLKSYNQIHDSINTISRKTLNQLDSKKEALGIKSNINWIPILLVLLLLIISAFLRFYNFKNKHEKLVLPKKNEVVLNKETEIVLVKKLAEFEQDKCFLKKDITLYSLANTFNCNTKYLSLTIKYKTNKSFSQYITDLRIEHILEQLDKDLKFRNYKISYLAEYCGFSSHNIFTSAFMAYTKEKPSSYIKKLKQQS